MTLDFIASANLIFSGPLAYVSLHPIPHTIISNEFDKGVGAGVWPRMVQVHYVKAHIGRSNGAPAAVTCIAQQANTVISKKQWG